MDEPEWDKDTNESCPDCGIELWFDIGRQTYVCPESEQVYYYSRTEGIKSINTKPRTTMKFLNIGSRVKCGEMHRGILAGYFLAKDQYQGDTTAYGVIELDEGYWTEDPKRTHISMLVVHFSNLEAE